jgi:glycosidase
MAVLFDWVADHTSWDNAWITNKAWYQQDGSGNIISPPNTGWTDVAALNFTSQDMRLAMISDMKYWIRTANIDGYRCDAADFVPADFWSQAIDTLRNITTHKLLLYAEGANKQEFTAGFQLQYGMGFYYTMKDQVFAAGRTVKLIDSLNIAEYVSAASPQQVVRYTSNHDVDNTDGTPLDLFGGRHGSMAVFLVAAYMNAVPMLYNGQEVGYPVKLTYFNDSTPIDWTTNPDMVAEYKMILTFRNTSTAVRRGVLASYNSNDVCAFTKTYNSDNVLVMANLRNAMVAYTVPAALTGSNWTSVVDGSSFTAGSTVALQPYEYRIYKNN